MFRFFVTLLVYLAIDIITLTAAFLCHFHLIVDADILRLYQFSLPLVLLVKTTVFTTFGEWQRQRRYSAYNEVISIVSTVTLSSSILVATNLAGLLEHGPPNPVIALDWCLSLFATGLMRAAARFEAARSDDIRNLPKNDRTLVYGAGAKSIALAKALNSAKSRYDVVALLDPSGDSERLVSSEIPVVTLTSGFAEIARRLNSKQLVIPDNLPGSSVRQLAKQGREHGLTVRVATDFIQITSEQFAPKVRDLTIADLYRAEAIRFDQAQVSELIADKTVLVTGAAGCIGAECCRQLLGHRPKALILVDQSEQGLRQIEDELTARHSHDVNLIFALSDINDQVTLGRVCSEHLPEVIIHAAGYSDLALLSQNVQIAIRNNVLGAKSVVDLAERFGVECVVLVSTDLAIRATNIAGATALIVEQYVQAMANSSKTQFITVRLGNTLCTTGCPTQTIQSQIENREPIVLDFAELTHTSMTIPDRVSLLLQAGAIGESGKLLMLDPGESIAVADLAKDLISLSGRRYPEEIDIVYSGIQPAKKISEPPFKASEASIKNIREKIFRIEREPIQLKNVKLNMQQLERATHGDAAEVCDAIRSLIPGFTADEIKFSANQIASLSKLGRRADQIESLLS